MKISSGLLVKRNVYIALAILLSLALMLPATFAAVLNKTSTVKDYGVRGQTFTIKERSLLEVIMSRLKQAESNGKIAQLQEQFKEKVKSKVINPVAVAGIIKTEAPRIFYYDPSYSAPEDIKDDQGRVVVAKGTSVNPLVSIAWGQPLIFIDGDDESQLTWGFKQTGKIVLVRGSPILLQEKLGKNFYFDQAGILTKKFGIKQVPAIVAQDGFQLKISEVSV